MLQLLIFQSAKAGVATFQHVCHTTPRNFANKIKQQHEDRDGAIDPRRDQFEKLNIHLEHRDLLNQGFPCNAIQDKTRARSTKQP